MRLRESKEREGGEALMRSPKMDVGLVGLGVMGKNLALNIIDKGFSVAGYDIDAAKGAQIEGISPHLFHSSNDLADLVEALKVPRAVMLLLPAGDMVDAVLDVLLRHLSKGDLLLDCGNSHFHDSDRRYENVRKKGLRFLGVGLSGGERGARFGPSIMVGGSAEGYERVRNVMEAVAARANGKPCVSYLGPGSAGNYVKMVHNGIEYGMMEIIAECYHLLKEGAKFGNDDIRQVFEGWSGSDLRGYLVEITAEIFAKEDTAKSNHGRLIDIILDEAKEKGTGKWTVQDAMELNVPVPTIAVSVAMRDVSRLKAERTKATALLPGPFLPLPLETEGFVTSLHKAMTFATLSIYAQGVAQLRAASRTYGYGLDLEEVTRIWGAGSIIRSDLLGLARDALRNDPDLPNLFLDPLIAQFVAGNQADMRRIVTAAIAYGIPVPAFSSSLSYFDAYRSSWLPANLIQAQRDYFGAHGYSVVGAEGTFHGDWKKQ
jgi:6-phosphogluconate dehydrogenase